MQPVSQSVIRSFSEGGLSRTLPPLPDVSNFLIAYYLFFISCHIYVQCTAVTYPFLYRSLSSAAPRLFIFAAVVAL